MRQMEDGNFTREAGLILKNKYGTVILDEAHKARARGGPGEKTAHPNNLLAFMLQIAKRTGHLMLGTATPIQTNVRELWDILEILSAGADFVLGDKLSPWRNFEQAIRLVAGKEQPSDTSEVWELLRNPLPPANEHDVISRIRDELGIRPADFYCPHKYDDLEYLVKDMWLSECLSDGFFRQYNPALRHIVLRKRKQLEDEGLLERVGVSAHPIQEKQGRYESRFVDLGIRTNAPFEVAYKKAGEFSRLLNQRVHSAGFMKTLMLQRICSSFASGLKTARRMLKQTISNENEDAIDSVESILSQMTPEEAACLREIENQLSRPEAMDSAQTEKPGSNMAASFSVNITTLWNG